MENIFKENSKPVQLHDIGDDTPFLIKRKNIENEHFVLHRINLFDMIEQA